jgi:hypothetical protein
VTNAAGINTTTSGISVLPSVTYYADADGDGFGNPAVNQTGCVAPAGYVTLNTDCNDAVAGINPAAVEICNAADENCNGLIDEGIAVTIYYADVDGDGFGNPNASDCADNSAAVNTNAVELCNNNVDDNCNGLIDDANGAATQQNIILCDGEFVVVGSNTYTTPGFYTDVLVAANGCDSTVTTLLEVIPYPIVTLTTSADTLCSNFLDVAQLTGTPAGGLFGAPASATGEVNSATIGDGVYDISYTYDMNGCATTQTVTVVIQICGGVEENSLSAVIAFPSPANENVSFKGLELGAPIQLFDATGKLVYSSKVNREIVTLNVKNYAEGVYTLKSEKAGKVGSISFLVKH